MSTYVQEQLNFSAAAARDISHYTGTRIRTIVGHDRPVLTARDFELIGKSSPYKYFNNIFPARNSDGIDAEVSLIRDYINNLPSLYRAEVARIASTIPAMDEECVVAINMPVRDEVGFLYESLKAVLVVELDKKARLAQRDLMTNKPLSANAYEITILINTLSSVDERDGSIEEVKKFISEYGHLGFHINTLEVSIPDDIANIGFVRKLLQDITLYRSIMRLTQKEPLIIATEDADIDAYDNYTLGGYTSYFSREDAAPAYMLKLERNNVLLAQIPSLFIKHLLETAAKDVLTGDQFNNIDNNNLQLKYNTVYPNGSGTAYRASALVLAGGFTICRRAEDLLLGEQMAIVFAKPKARQSIQLNIECVEKSATILVASPRRIVAGYITNTTDWNADYFFDTNKERLMRSSDQTLIRAAQLQEKKLGKEKLQGAIEECRNKIRNTAPAQLTTSRQHSMLLSSFERRYRDSGVCNIDTDSVYNYVIRELNMKEDSHA